MGSRLREHPDRLFEVFMEVAKPNGTIDFPFVLQKYPDSYKDEDVLKSSPKFAYPCEIDCGNVDHFTFVFTDIEGLFKFGFCRHTPGAQTTLCIISCLPWFEIFYKLLNMIAEILNRSELNSVVPLLEETYNLEVPMPKVPVTIVANQEMFSFSGPDPNQLPSIPASRNLTEYYNAIDTHNMMIIFAHMLNERRILVTSKKLSRLTSCIHAAEALLYPMNWQHLFIPVLPAHGNLMEYVSAPMPYLIGVHSSLLPKVLKMEIGDAVIVDADKNTVQTCHEDFQNLPEDVAAYLKKCLRPDKLKNSMMESGDAISKAFLQALVRLIGGYRDALKFRTGEPITFDPDQFVLSRSSDMQGFLQNMLQLQIFQQFINNRLDMLNTGYGFSDTFEQLALTYADKLNTQSKYKEWQTQMKKQGKKLQKGGKDIWSDLKEKAAPMMTTAVQSVKSHSKKAYSDIRARLNEMQTERSPGSKNSLRSGNSPSSLNRSRPSTIAGTEFRRERMNRTVVSPVSSTPGEVDRKIPFADFESSSTNSSSSSSSNDIHSYTQISNQTTEISADKKISTQSSEMTFDKKIGTGLRPSRPPRPKPKPRVYSKPLPPEPSNEPAPPEKSIDLVQPPSETKPERHVEESPLISFNDEASTVPKNPMGVTFNSDVKQNDLLYSLSSGSKQSPSSLNRSSAFRQSDRSPKIQGYVSNVYTPPQIRRIETDPVKLFDPLANSDIQLPKVQQHCDSKDLLGDLLMDVGSSKTSPQDLTLDSFDPLATPPSNRQTGFLNASLQSSASGSSRSFEDLFSNTSLDTETAKLTSNITQNSSATDKQSSSPFTTWTTFE